MCVPDQAGIPTRVEGFILNEGVPALGLTSYWRAGIPWKQFIHSQEIFPRDPSPGPRAGVILLQGSSHKIPYMFPGYRSPTRLSAVAFKSRDAKKFIHKHAKWACAGLALDAGGTGVRWGEAHEFRTPAG